MARAGFCNFLQFPKHSHFTKYNVLSCFYKFYLAYLFDFTCNFLRQLLSIFALNVKVLFKTYALKLQFNSRILFKLTSFATNWLRLNVIHDATVGLHYRSSATIQEVLVPLVP